MDKEKLIAEAEQNAYKDMLLAMIDVCHPRSVYSKREKLSGILGASTEHTKMAKQ